MNFRVFIPNSVERDLRKLDRKALPTVKEIILKQIAVTPELGKTLKGFQKISVWKVRFGGVDYRIAYRRDSKEAMIYILLVKSRENFYKELGKRIG